MNFFDEKAEYLNQKFQNLDLSKEVIASKDFQACTFTKCKFVDTQFKECRFVDCVFLRCDLSLAVIAGCAFHNVSFEHSKAMGVNWSDAKWLPGFSLIRFLDCGINYSVFMGLDLRKISIVQCVAKEVNFEDARLEEADLRKTDFMGSRFVNTNLTQANFIGAINYAIDVTLNAVKKTKFSLPEAISLLRSLDIVLEGDNIVTEE